MSEFFFRAGMEAALKLADDCAAEGKTFSDFITELRATVRVQDLMAAEERKAEHRAEGHEIVWAVGATYAKCPGCNMTGPELLEDAGFTNEGDGVWRRKHRG